MAIPNQQDVIGEVFQSWGEPWNQSIRHSTDWNCDKCNWSFLDQHPLPQIQYVVGFSTNIPIPSHQHDVVGILIVECPNCFSKFFFHLTRLFWRGVERARRI